MKKFNATTAAVLAAAALALSSTGASAQVEDIAGMGDQFFEQGGAIVAILGMFSFIAGFAFVVAGIMKLRAHAANPQDPQNKASTGIILAFVGAAMVAVPTVMGIGVQSLFGDGSTTTNMSDKSGGGFTAID